MALFKKLPKDESELPDILDPKVPPYTNVPYPHINITPKTTLLEKWTAVKQLIEPKYVQAYAEAFLNLMKIHKVYPDSLIELIDNIEKTKLYKNYP